VYSGEYDVSDVTLHECASTPGKLKSLLGHGGRGFDSHRGQENFSACPVLMHTQSNIKNEIFDRLNPSILHAIEFSEDM
jgi:hypothetical protein